MSTGRRRLGVALVLDPPVADEVDGLRRAVGDPSFGRIPAHLTLVPPVNVRAADLGQALTRLRDAAARLKGALRLTLGPVSTFLPDNPVLYLGVGGDLEALRVLRDAVFVSPLERPLSWPWVPHVTLADTAAAERIEAAVMALSSYSAVARIDRVVLLEERAGRIWVPLADAALGPRVVVGTGGLAVEITRGRVFDPEVHRMLADLPPAEPPEAGEGESEPSGGDLFPVVLTARREGEVVGLATSDGVFVAPAARGQGIGRHLAAHYSNSTAE